MIGPREIGLLAAAVTLLTLTVALILQSFYTGTLTIVDAYAITPGSKRLIIIVVVDSSGWSKIDYVAVNGVKVNGSMCSVTLPPGRYVLMIESFSSCRLFGSEIDALAYLKRPESAIFPGKPIPYQNNIVVEISVNGKRYSFYVPKIKQGLA